MNPDPLRPPDTDDDPPARRGRCLFCRRRVWFWQRQGHYVGTVRVLRWHSTCKEGTR